jgi:hypothetical protein
LVTGAEVLLPEGIPNRPIPCDENYKIPETLSGGISLLQVERPEQR